MSRIETIKQAIMADPQNKEYTDKGIEPLFAAPKTARINIIGQAPGLKTQEAGIYWKDKSGDRLLTKTPFIILVCLRSFPWTFISQGMENLVIFHLAKALRKSGTLNSSRSVQRLS
jgi:hypothetical protein